MEGLLIVNADDWGAEEANTDAIRDAFAAGAITSASAMVYMEDSDRAAAIARRERLGLGLHLNLTQPFSDSAAPLAVRGRQQALLEHFRDPRRRQRSFDLSRRAAVHAAVADQFARFHELYGRAPDHLDGHEHVHLCLDVLLALPRGLKVRPAISGLGGPLEMARFAGAASAARGAVIRARLRAPRHAFDFWRLSQEPVSDIMELALDFSDRTAIEVMCHPDRPEELRVLTSERWRRALAGRPLGTYADLG